MHIRKSMCKKVDFCVEVREVTHLLRVHNGYIGYLGFPVITPLPLAEDRLVLYLQISGPEGVRRNALRAQRPKSPHFEESAQA